MAASSRLRVDLLPCPDLRKKRYRPGLSDSPAEVESRLLVAAGVKLPPQLEQKIGHLRQHRLNAMNRGMAGRGRPNNAVTRRNLSPLSSA